MNNLEVADVDVDVEVGLSVETLTDAAMVAVNRD
jgi:hypothetical protein